MSKKTSRERLVKRIIAMIAKAQSTPYEEERDAFMAKANALMAQHAVEESELHEASESFQERIVSSVPVPYRYHEWVWILAGNVSAYVGCRCYIKKNSMMLVGRNIQVEMAEQLLLSLVNQIREKVKEFAAGNKVLASSEKARYNFMFGAAMTVSARLQGMMRDLQQNHAEASAIISTTSDEIDAWVRSKGAVEAYKPQRPVASETSFAEYAALHRGAAAGHNVLITEGLNHGADD